MDLARGKSGFRMALVACLAIAAGNAAAQAHVFMTSSTGTGDLSSWPESAGATGLEAADAICRAHADSGSLEGADEYVAWLSDSSDDAYCRAHGLGGKRSERCGQAQDPIGAGPWSRIDGLPAMDVLPLSAPWPGSAGYQPRHVLFDESGQPIPFADFAHLAFTATDTSGQYNGGGSCDDWTSTAGEAMLGSAYYGFGGFSSSIWDCAQSLRMVCLRKGEHGAPLSRHLPPSARIAFASSAVGTGDLGSWPQAGDANGLAAGDAICRGEAAAAGLPLAMSYRAWLSASAVPARGRFDFDGPWYRVDGVRVATSVADLADGFLDAPIQMTATGTELGFESVWTGTHPDGSSTGSTCGDWSSVSASGTFGVTAAAEPRWSESFFSAGCGAGNLHLFCLADNDSLFLEGFD